MIPPILVLLMRIREETMRRWMGAGMPIKAVRIGAPQYIEMKQYLSPLVSVMTDDVCHFSGVRYYVDPEFDGVEIEYVEESAAVVIVALEVAAALNLPCRAL